jgi:serine/threonine protein kinase
LNPLEAVLIDFGMATLTSAKKTNRKLGTPGYFPNRNWNEGSDLYDIWAMGAIIMEADM